MTRPSNKRSSQRGAALTSFKLNGEPVTVAFAPHKTLLEVLREDLRLTGTKHGCELGECGTCAVLVKKGMENLGKKTIFEKVNFTLHPLGAFKVIGHEDEMRLSCQCKVEGDVEIEVRPAFNLSGETFWTKPFPFNK